MIIEKLIEEPLNSIDQISELTAMSTSPCLSIYLPRYSPQSDSIPFGVQLLAALQRARQKLDTHATSADNLPLEQLREFARDRRWNKERGGLAIFCAPNFIRLFQTSHTQSESVYVENDFHILPLLSGIIRNPQFAILALSENHARLLRCNNLQVFEVDLPPSVPRSVEQTGAFDKPDHDLENRSAAGSAPGSRRRIHFGTDTANEKTEEYFSQFFRLLDHKINQLYGVEKLPLILAAVKREVALYKKLSSYPNLLQGCIPGSPERASNSQLLSSALQVLETEAALEEDSLLSEFTKAESTGRTSTDVISLISAARLGAIQHLFLREQKGHPDKEQTLNRIAIQTFRHGGHVAIFAHRQLPSGSSAAAILRYRESDVKDGSS